MDAYGTDSDRKKYDLEIQRADKGAEPYRARYHSSVLDIENLHSGQEFKELPDTYTIFITEEDFFGMGKPVYPIESFIGLPRWYLRLIMRYTFHNLLAGGHNLTFLFHKHQIAGN